MDMKTFVSSLTDFEKEQLGKVLSASNESLFPTLNEVQRYNRGDRVSAIIAYKRRSGLNLKEAKDSIETAAAHYTRTGVIKS